MIQGPTSIARARAAHRPDGDANNDPGPRGFEHTLADEVGRRRDTRVEPEAGADEERERPREEPIGLVAADTSRAEARSLATTADASARSGDGTRAAQGGAIVALNAEGGDAAAGGAAAAAPAGATGADASPELGEPAHEPARGDDELASVARVLRAAARASTAEHEEGALALEAVDPMSGDEEEPIDLPELDASFDDMRQHLDARSADAARASSRVAAADADRGVADQLADAVRRLAAESLERADVVRFRAQGHTFAAVVAHDGQHPQLRLVADDPATRTFLGERLPEVRQALERVGFAATGLSVAADGEHRHHHHQPDPSRDEDAGEATPASTRAARARGATSSGAAAEPSRDDPARTLDLIL